MQIELLRAVCALIFVIGLMFGCLAVYKKFFMGRNITNGKTKRMEVLENLYLDRQRRLIIIKKDNEEITLLLGVNTETVIK